MFIFTVLHFYSNYKTITFFSWTSIQENGSRKDMIMFFCQELIKLERVDHQLLLTYYYSKKKIDSCFYLATTQRFNETRQYCSIYRKIQAFIYDATPLEYHAGNDNNCELRTVGEKYAMTGYGIAVPQKASYLEEINEVILELKENGNYCIAFLRHSNGVVTWLCTLLQDTYTQICS